VRRIYLLGLLLAGCNASGEDLDAGATGDGGGLDGGNADTGVEGPRVVYYRDIKPIVDRNCVQCHSPTGIGPIDLTVPAVAVAARDKIKEQVSSKLMPPWHASEDCRGYEHDRSLDDDTIDLIVEWVDLGAPLGDPSQEPPPGAPPSPGLARIDLELPLPSYTANVGDDYRCQVVEWTEAASKFVTGFNLVPTNPQIVHHSNIYVVNANGAQAVRDKDAAAPGPGYPCFGGAFEPGVELLGAWAPGSTGLEYPSGTGIQIDPGSLIILEMHYFVLRGTDNTTDDSTLALRVEDQVDRRALVAPFWNFQEWSQGRNMPIPADDPNVTHSIDLDPNGFVQLLAPWLTARNIRIYGAGLHMHFLGTSGKVHVIRGDQSHECLLEIPRWDFNWQYGYILEEPTDFLIGRDHLYLECHWDNTAGNQPIIDGVRRPVQAANWGGRSTDEMCIGYVYVTEQ
jgi:hypothetical protein